MTALLWASASGALAVLTWLHLRPSGIRAAEAMPSLQHLDGSPPRRRRTLPLEEALGWALRAACLLLALSGIWASRRGCTADVRPVALLDSAAPAEAWAEAAGRTEAAARLGFHGEQPAWEGDVPVPMQAALRECSGSKAACLLRAAALSGRPPVLVGPLETLEWRLALGQWGQPFAFLRSRGGGPPEEAPAPLPPRAHVRLTGTSSAAQGWAAALAVAAGAPVGPSAGRADTPLVEVVQPGQASGPAPAGALRVLAVESPAPAQPEAPAVLARGSRGLLLPDPLDVAAGTPGLGLLTSLGLAKDGRFAEVLPMAALEKPPGPRQLVLAASAEELGAWAHQGNLVPLARALLAAGLPGPATVLAAPAGGPLGWRDAARQRAPVGLLDVHPGEYLREDGRVALHLARSRVPGPATLDDAELSRLGGQPWSAPAPRRLPWPPLLFALALASWAWAVWLSRTARAAWLPAAGVAAGLGLLWADASYQATRAAPFEAVLALPPGASAARLARLAQQKGVGLHAASDTGCALAGAVRPCTLLGTLALAEAPAEGTNILLFDASRPRVDVLQVEAPHEVALGQAAQLWVTLRVRRAQGRTVTLTARSTSAAPTSQQVSVDADDVVRTVRLSVAPLTEGLSFVGVQAALVGEAQAQDGRLLTLATRARTAQRLVLAAAPGWEARAAAEALETPGADVQVLSRLGTRAVVARGRAAQSPLALLGTAEALKGVELLVLVGFGHLDGAQGAALRHYVQSGGAVLLLDAPGAAAALGVELAKVAATAPLQLLQGQLDEEVVDFRGYAPAAPLQEAPLATVLGRLGPAASAASRPWVVGRALGQGRLAVVTAPDMWRVSPPGEGKQAYRTVLARLVGWLLAPGASRDGVRLAEDWASVHQGTLPPSRTWPLPLTGPVDGLAVDAVDFETLLPWPRARLRAAALARHHPFLEVDGEEALGAAWGRLPEAPRWRGRVPLRKSDSAFAVLAALLALEAVARRRYGGGTTGTRATSASSSSDTGGTTSGEGRSQRDRATPAARAAAPREASSRPA
ncbi:MAG: hypothetical protein ACLPM8_06410 [Myxococcaceae bacterium]